ncbi:porin family protein [Colwellia sp. D2M02]|uniref:porin family protein n=1 Tax=Colwellia sp. D2M02 TaxID=2841562 RepID=UPI001C09F6D5|nr:porin family protein [Colwellia sp. D2M02]MBU2892235.1 porin family protein [Colwellia sp. D2M02]
MNKTLCLVTLALSLIFTLTAQAENESDFYVGVQYSNQNIESSSDLSTAGVILGYQFNQYFSLETRLNMGVSEYSALCPCGEEDGYYVYKQKIDNQGSLLIKGTYPILNDFSIYALAGVIKTSYSLETQSQYKIVEENTTVSEIRFQDTRDHSESGFTYGVGINYQISKKFSAFLDYQVLPDLAVSTLDSSNWNSASIGVNYTF